MQDPETPAAHDVRRLTRGARLRYAEIGLVVAATSCATYGTALTGRHRPRRAKSRPVIGSCSPPDRPERRTYARAEMERRARADAARPEQACQARPRIRLATSRKRA